MVSVALFLLFGLVCYAFSEWCFVGGKFLTVLLLFDALGLVCVEEFVGLVLAGGKVTVPKQLRARFDVSDGCYVRLVLVEVLTRGEGGVWVKRRVE
jgi:hypothetical protein